MQFATGLPLRWPSSLLDVCVLLLIATQPGVSRSRRRRYSGLLTNCPHAVCFARSFNEVTTGAELSSRT